MVDLSADPPGRRSGILAVLAATQFVMVLDSTVMNVSIARLVEDLNTTIVGIQTAITLFTLVMASTMIAGGKLGDLMGRKHAFRLGLIVYACGSGLTAASQNAAMLYIGWSLLEGLGAALILPALAALVASNFQGADRPMAYGVIAAAAAVAVASGPLIGGAATTYLSWRYVFVGEVVICAVILAFTGVIAAPPTEGRRSFDIVGAILSIVGMSGIVFGVLMSSEWGWVRPSAGAPAPLGISGTSWLVASGLLALWLFGVWQRRRTQTTGAEPLVDPVLFGNRNLVGGVLMIAMQQFILAGALFAMPIYLSITLGLSAFNTGLTIMPLSVGLILAAVWISKVLLKREMGPRAIVQWGLGTTLVAIVLMFAVIRPELGSRAVLGPLFVMGIGIGLLAGQIANVIQSSVDLQHSGQAGGLQYTSQYFGSSLGTALVGAVMLGTLASAALSGIESSPTFGTAVREAAGARVAGGVSFVSDQTMAEYLDQTSLAPVERQAVTEINTEARLRALRSGMVSVSFAALIALLCTGLLPTTLPQSAGRPPGPAQTTGG